MASNKWRLAHRDELAAEQGVIRGSMRAFILLLKEDPCTDCGVVDLHYVMEWDHCRGTKVRSVMSSRTWNQLDSELKKCDLLCARCHRIRTWNRIHNS